MRLIPIPWLDNWFGAVSNDAHKIRADDFILFFYPARILPDEVRPQTIGNVPIALSTRREIVK